MNADFKSKKERNVLNFAINNNRKTILIMEMKR